MYEYKDKCPKCKRKVSQEFSRRHPEQITKIKCICGWLPNKEEKKNLTFAAILTCL